MQSETDSILSMGEKLLESSKMYLINNPTELWDHVLY